MNNPQLTLFTEKGSEYFRAGADALLEAVNLGVKKKEQYQIEYYYSHKDVFVVIAVNKEKNIICNVVDQNGNIPKGFSVNWRIHSMVVDDLNEKLN